MNPQSVFKKVYEDSTNFMTPNIEEYRFEQPYAIEISTGFFRGKKKYGLTVIDTSNNQLSKRPDISCICHNLTELNHKLAVLGFNKAFRD